MTNGVYDFQDCKWIKCSTNGHGGCIFFNHASSTLNLKYCSFIEGYCIGSTDRAGGICVQNCKNIIMDSICYYKCYSAYAPGYVLWSSGFSLLNSKSDRISEQLGSSKQHGSITSGSNSHFITSSNCSRVYAPTYFGGIGFHPIPAGLVGKYCQCADSYTEGMVSFYSGSLSFEMQYWNLINNTIPSGSWFCVHNYAPSLRFISFIIKKNTAHGTLFSMNGGASAYFESCLFDISYNSAFFGTSLTQCSFNGDPSLHKLSLYDNEICQIVNKETLFAKRKSLPIFVFCSFFDL